MLKTRRRFVGHFAILATLAAVGCVPTTRAKHPASQPSTRPSRPVSPVVADDRRVTFRVWAPLAQEVEVWGDWPAPKGGPATRDASGVWAATLGPIPSGLWSYNFKIDGQYFADRANPVWKPGREVASSVLDLPDGASPAPWDRRAGVPRGTVHLHDYFSPTLARERRLRVYTPSNYDANAGERFPVLYLLHGSGDNETTWSEFGRANVILDNLIAAGAARPMIVVMTDGHAIGGGAPDVREKNANAFSDDLLKSVMPLIDSTYRTQANPASRAIAGLSMGGNQAILIGLHHPELFSAIVGMSSAIREPQRDLGDLYPPSTSAPATTRDTRTLFYLTIGTDDFLLKQNRAFDAFLTQANVAHEYHETAGGHTWPVWRANLIAVLPRLFKR